MASTVNTAEMLEETLFLPERVGVSHVFRFEVENGLDQQATEDRSAPGNSTDLCKFFFQGGCTKGAFCQYRHSRNDRLVVCKHWLRGLCKKNEYCEYLHEFDMSKMPECYFFSKFNECSNAECMYRHIDPEKKRNECPYYNRGFCRHGPKCRYRHIRKEACTNYLGGFCKDGPTCVFGHPKFEMTRMDDEGNSQMPSMPSTNPPTSYAPMPSSSVAHAFQSTAEPAEAPQPHQDEVVDGVVCHYCQRPGHIRPQCPLKR
mmetsp:Transcript_8278/g.16800  ORF Transcript_8278/g.16800 Transcript_8278/m.16800 type:complete len:259 (+) Transcript_8278:82-858(+)